MSLCIYIIISNKIINDILLYHSSDRYVGSSDRRVNPTQPKVQAFNNNVKDAALLKNSNQGVLINIKGYVIIAYNTNC